MTFTRVLIAFTLLYLPQVFAADTTPIRQLLERTTGQPIHNLELILQSEPQQKDWFKVSSKHGKAIVQGNSLSSLSYGAYQLLRDYGALAVSWEGTRTNIPERFDNIPSYQSHSLVEERVYLNVCAYGYSTPWWGWDRWQQELDWMALHGVNQVIAMEGQEAIWQKLWLEFGISQKQLNTYFSGPAFTPWQRMGNIEGHFPPITENWIAKKKNLQVKILTRMSELGIKPIVPAFGGYVPSAFKEKFPTAAIYEMEPWSGFDQPSYWLDPKDPLFNKIAKRFIEIYNATYGKAEYYLSDSFNEMLPPVSEQNRNQQLKDYGKAIYQSITQVVPDATWVMQGWMFGADKQFWDTKSIEAFLSGIPDEKVRIHDIGNDRYAVWEGANAFFNKPWVLGYIHNYGASNPVYGNFNFYDKTFMHAINAKNHGNLRGYGAFPEGINNNSIVYEYLFDVPWSRHHKHPFSNWLQRYTQARYGKSSQELIKTWEKLEQAIYSTQYWSPRWLNGSAGAYLFFKRPTLSLIEFTGHPGNLPLLGEAIQELLKLQPQYAHSDLYLYDLIELVRHYTTMRMDELLQKTIKAYQSGNISQANKNIKTLKQITALLDKLLGGQHESLATWLKDAYDYGETKNESQRYVFNAKKQITTWGGLSLKDYASKAWQGMYKDFYLQRWLQFFTALQNSSPAKDSTEKDSTEKESTNKSLANKALTNKNTFNEETFNNAIRNWENTWAEEPQITKRHKPKHPVKLIKKILQRLPGAFEM